MAEAVYDMVEPGGALVLVGHQAEGRAVPPSPGPPRIPHDEIEDLVRKYLGPTRRAGQSTAPVQALSLQDALASTRFGAPRVIFAPGIPDLVRDIESVVSGYFSMSYRRAAPVRRPCRRIRRRGARAAARAISRRRLLGLAR